MSEPETAELVNQALAALARGDLAQFAGRLSPHAVWHVAGDTPLAGDYHGRDGILGLFGAVSGLTGGSLRTEPPEVTARGTLAVCWRHMKGHHWAEEFDVEEVLVIRVEHDRLQEVWEVTDLFRGRRQVPIEPGAEADHDENTGATPATDATRTENANGVTD